MPRATEPRKPPPQRTSGKALFRKQCIDRLAAPLEADTPPAAPRASPAVVFAGVALLLFGLLSSVHFL